MILLSRPVTGKQIAEALAVKRPKAATEQVRAACPLLLQKTGASEEASAEPSLSSGLGGACGTGSQGGPGGWDSGWPGSEPRMRRNLTLAWPQGHSQHRSLGLSEWPPPPQQETLPRHPLSHPVFPRVVLLLFPVGAAARNHALLREEAGPQLWGCPASDLF